MLNNTKKKKLCIKCQACCKLLYIPTKSPSKGALKFYTIRGCSFIKVKGEFCVAVSSICPQLTKEGCKIYDNRPEDCMDYDGRKDPILKHVCLWDTANQGALKKGTPRIKGGLK